MEISGRIARQTLLYSLLVLVVSMLIFPEKYGTGLPDAPLVNVVFELVFYGLVAHLLNRRLSPLQLILSASLCLVYRFAMGAASGLMIVALYGWQLKTALVAGMGSYLPGMLLQIVAAPFILKPVIDSLQIQKPSLRPNSTSGQASLTADYATSVAVSRERGYSRRASSAAEISVASSATAPASPGVFEGSGFERATRYIGEDGTVLVAAVVDREGLLLGHFSRRGFDAEDWAPFALTLVDKNNDVVSRLNCSAPVKIDLLLSERRIVVACDKDYSLMVVAERAMDEVLNIRINQGLEIIRKYVSERYSEKLIGNVEKTYV